MITQLQKIRVSELKIKLKVMKPLISSERWIP